MRAILHTYASSKGFVLSGEVLNLGLSYQPLSVAVRVIVFEGIGRLRVTKSSVNLSKYAAIYMGDQQPRYGPNEPKMTKEATEVAPGLYQRLHAMC